MSYHLLSRLRPLRASAILFTNIVSVCSGFLWHQPHHLSLQRQLIHHQDASSYVPVQRFSMSNRDLVSSATDRGHEFVDDGNVSVYDDRIDTL